MAVMIGEFNRRITLKMNPTKVSNGSGGYTVSGYGSTISTWSRVNDKGGNRFFDQTGKDGLERRKTFDVFYRSAINSVLDKDAIIVYDGKEYQVDDFNKVEEEKTIIRIEGVTAD